MISAYKEQWVALSAAQLSRWFMYQLDPASQGSHNIVFSARLHGVPDQGRLQAAVQQLLQHHPMLRTRFRVHEGQPQQALAAQYASPLSVYDAGNCSAEELKAMVAADAARAFDLSQAPLIRIKLYQTGPADSVLLLVFDHIVGDGWSYWQILEELGALLAGDDQHAAANQISSQDNPYFHYVQWQAEWLRGPAAQSQWHYWEKNLGRELSVLHFPADHVRPAQSSNRRGSFEFFLGKELSAELREFVKAQASTMFAVLLAAYHILLHRHSGQEQIVVGCPMPGRTRADWDHVVGDFVNPIALKAEFDGDPSVAQFLRQVRSSTLRGISNQDYPFPHLVEKLDPSRDLNEAPLFQTMFTFQKARHGLELLALRAADLSGEVDGETRVNWGGLQLSAYDVHQSGGGGNHPLSLETLEFEDRIGCVLAYDMDLFEAATIERIAGRFQVLLRAMLDNVEQHISRLPLLDEAERNLLLHAFNQTAAERIPGQLIHRLFEEQTARTPDATALIFAGQSLSYAQLNARANQLAHHLLQIGAKPDQRVAICIERSLEMLIGMLGILKAGAAYVPLDPAHPAERLAYMLEDSQPLAMLTQRSLLPSLPQLQIPLLLLEESAPLLAQQPEHNPQLADLHAGHMAYVLYTSGSTGAPKGVMVEHGNVVNLIHNHIHTCDITADDKVLQFASFGFDNSIAEIFPALTVGACIVMRPAELVTPDASFISFIQNYGITFADLPTAFWHLWAQEVRLGRSLPGPHLRLVAAGGEKAELRHLLTWLREPGLANCRWLNTYGPTEATVNATNILYGRDAVLPEHEIPIGRPIANNQIYILDQHLQPVPLGVVGEVHIGGLGVARGYLNREQLTREKFIPHPFSNQAGARIYKTGDLGRWLADGTIEYMGRNDFQVKFRGFRIELGDIEAKLADCAGVKEAVVIAREDRPGEKRLVAYLIPHEGVELSANELRVQLAQQLAEYMIPSAFVSLTAYPLNQNGKIDRRALPVPDMAAVGSRSYEAPQGVGETTLARIWEELLHLDEVGRNDHFFELGGHSLMVINLIERLREEGFHADVRSIFSAPVLHDMAALLGDPRPLQSQDVAGNQIAPGTTRITPEMLPLVSLRQSEIDAIVASVPGGVTNVQDIYPLAPLQEGILFHHLLEQEGDAYLLRSVLCFDNRQGLDSFLNAMQTVISRHDILRSAVRWQGLAHPVQVVVREATLPVHQLQLDDVQDPVAQLQAMTDPRHMRIDLQQAPLFAAYIAADPRNAHNAGNAWLLALLDHHMICDHITLALILQEIKLLMQGQAEQLPTPLPYRNYIASLHNVSQTQHEAYFQRQLADFDEPSIPFGVADVQSRGEDVEEAHLALPAKLGQVLRKLAQSMGVSTASLFHVAFAQMVGQTSAKADVVFGTVLSGRLQGGEGGDKVMGMFINALPLRVDLQHPLREVVRSTHRHLSELVVHEQAALTLAQQCSAVAAPAPLFTALLNFRHTTDHISADGVTTLDWEGVHLIPGEERTNYPLTLCVDDMGTDFAFTCQAVQGIDAKRVLHYLQQAVEVLLQALEGNDSRHADTLCILPEREKRLLLGSAPQAAAALGPDLLSARFEHAAANWPQRIALSWQGAEQTYAELNAEANRVAHWLLAQGVQPDQAVALCLEPGFAMLAAILGVLKAGAAYLPLDPAYPADRLAYTLQDAQPVALIAAAGALDVLPADSRQRWPSLIWEEAAAVLDAQPQHNPQTTVAGHNLAYIIYTSGSTGLPKGVMIEHRQATRLFDATQHWFHFDQNDVWTLFHSFAFDFSVWEIWGALLFGGKLVIVPKLISRAPQDFYSLLCAQKVTVLNQTPSAFRSLIAAQDQGQHSLRSVIFGGEALELHTLRPWIARNPLAQTELVNMYGITETTVHVTYRKLNAADIEGNSGSVIGVAIPDLSLHILDAHMRPAAYGVSGEIYVGGAGVARGYLQRPELNAERFLPDPFSTDPQARLYKSGDLGRRLANGDIEYLGRNDFQVKIRGFRIELGEIEAKLAACPGIRDAVVIAREDMPGDQRLVAYFTSHGGQTPAAQELREQLLQSLAQYMVPSAFVHLPQLPLTTNGKLDRKALPIPDYSNVSSDTWQAPQGDTEIALAGIWQEVLGIEQVGRLDHFFALGGHSLLAVQLISRVRQTFACELQLKDLFEHPCLQDLALCIARAAHPALPPITAVARATNLPLSFSQQRLWFLSELDQSAAAAYHMPVALRLQGKLRKDVLRAVLNTLVARHESLRTTFVVEDGETWQKIAAPEQGFSLQEQDLQHLPDLQQSQAVQEVCVREVQIPFNLAQGPLIRGQLLILAEDEHMLLINQHHIISDGWSVSILIKEFAELYARACEGQDVQSVLPPLNLQYADYAQWQRAWLQGDNLQQQVAFWRAHLQGAPVLLDLPLDYPRPARQNHAGASQTLSLAPELSAKLRRFSISHGNTVFMTLLAAWGALMARISGQQEVVIGTPVANRQHAEMEGVAGFFVNMLALRLYPESEMSVQDFLAQVRSTTLAAQAHQDLPFEQVVEALQPQRNLAHSPLFQVMFSLYSGTDHTSLELPGLHLQSQALPHTHTAFDLALALHDDGETIRGQLDYARGLFAPATIERWLQKFSNLLHALVDGSQTQQIRELPLLTQAERGRVLNSFNPPPQALSGPQLITHLFAQQVASRADARALQFEGRSYTYAQLQQEVLSTAAYLRTQGVQAGQAVALCVNRGPAMVSALLAIMQVGAAYLPLDPSYPQARLQFMLQDSQAQLVLSESALQQQVTELLAGLEQAPQLLLLDQLPAASAEVRRSLAENCPLPLDGKALAYMIYTSGSTGMPKGVLNHHRGLCNLVRAQIDVFGIKPESRVLQFASFSFDASISEIMTALCSGACLHLVQREQLQDSAKLQQLLLEQGITHVTLPASVLATFADDAHFPGLTLVVAGEACPPALAHRFAQKHVLINAYGPTETTVCATAWRYPQAQQQVLPTLPIGTPIANTRIYILDEYLQAVPVGVRGEIYIGGIGVADGYHQRPELNEERFLADPFSSDSGARMYKSGDLGRWRDDGVIEYLGRNDFQVKLRGFRIELGEIEACLLAQPEIRSAAVLARSTSSGQSGEQDQRLVAYVVPAEGASLDLAQLRSALAARVAEYMLPSAFVQLQAMPLTANGKLDRAALPAPEWQDMAQRPYQAPEGEIEQALAVIWQELLGLSQVGRHDNFFELGGHSLLATRLAARVRDSFGVELALAKLFQTPSVAALAEEIFAQKSAALADADLALLGADLDNLSEEELLKLLAEEDAAISDTTDAADTISD